MSKKILSDKVEKALQRQVEQPMSQVCKLRFVGGPRDGDLEKKEVSPGQFRELIAGGKLELLSSSQPGYYQYAYTYMFELVFKWHPEG